jgi:hypothetical protein
MIQEVFKKYLRKTTVQKGIVSQTIKQTLLKLINPDSGLKCSYQNELIFITNCSHEDKIQIYLQKALIISKWQKKLLEDFAINAIIKDIRIT